MSRRGLKLLRSGHGPMDPNRYWRRKPRSRCPQCGRKVRGKNHAAGHR